MMNNNYSGMFESKWRLGSIALVALLSLLLGACDKARLTGDSETFVTSGTANDADPNNGAPVIYPDPNRTGADGNTSATSDPKSYRQLAGHVIASPGPNAPVGSTAAATASNKATSFFRVEEPGNYRYLISTTVAIALNRGRGGVVAIARVLDGNGTTVPGSEYRVRYDFTDKGGGKLGIKINTEPEIEVDNPATGWTDSRRRIPDPAFRLTPGRYTMQFEVEFGATAPLDGNADVQGISSVDLK